MLTHHLCLGVAMAGVEAVGTAGAGHRLSQPQRGEAEYLAWVARPQRLAHAPATHSIAGEAIVFLVKVLFSIFIF